MDKKTLEAELGKLGVNVKDGKVGKSDMATAMAVAAASDSDRSEFNYMMLGRLQRDCEYFLGAGDGNPKHLHQDNVSDQIKEMKRLWHNFPKDKKPEWLSLEDIDDYEKRMNNYYDQLGSRHTPL
jgi:hypothetical protein